jgi:hypothetical protein
MIGMSSESRGNPSLTLIDESDGGEDGGKSFSIPIFIEN